MYEFVKNNEVIKSHNLPKDVTFAVDVETGNIVKSCTLKYHHTDRQIDLNYIIGLAEDMKDALEVMRDGKNFAVNGEVL